MVVSISLNLASSSVCSARDCTAPKIGEDVFEFNSTGVMLPTDDDAEREAGDEVLLPTAAEDMM